MPTSVRLDPGVEARLGRLAETTGRSKAYYVRELIEQGLEDLEDAYLGAAVAERVRLGKERTYSFDEVVSELGLDPEVL
jgi:RHH-type rel operon transcriptional repressor/antitoxin RelB